MDTYTCMAVGVDGHHAYDDVDANSEEEAKKAMHEKYPDYITFSCYIPAPPGPTYPDPY